VSRSPGQELGDRLAALKDQSGRSYTALARRTGISRSSLHRYCQGHGVPESYGPIETVARACGASRSELLELHRLWVQATTRTTTSRPAGPVAAPPAVGGAGVVGLVGEGGLVGVGGPEDPVIPKTPGNRPDRALRPPRWRWWRWPGRLRTARMAVGLVTALAAVWLTTGDVSAVRPLPRIAETLVPQQISGPAWSDLPMVVPADYFGVTVASPTGEMPAFQVGTVRLWDSGTSWAALEPRRGWFDWSSLDRLVHQAQVARLPVMLTFGATPAWASPDGPRAPYPDDSRASPPGNLADWDDYVRAVAARYGNRIGAYELWNLAPSREYFTGSAEQLAQMTQRASAILHSKAPDSTIVCPGMGDLWQPAARQFMLRFAQAGGYQHCDVAAVDLEQRQFGETPESLIALADLVQDTLRSAGVVMRMWDTGAPTTTAPGGRLDQARATDYAVRFYLLGLYLRYERMYFYDWGDLRVPIVLQSVGGAPTQAALFVAELQRWLHGARIDECGHGEPDGLPSKVWECRFQIPSEGRRFAPAVIRWTDTGRVRMTAESGVYGIQRLNGQNVLLRPGADLEIGEQPILIRYGGADAS